MSIEIPKKLRRAVGKIEAAGDEPILICPALIEKQATQRMLAMARIGMENEKIFSWIVAGRKSVHFVRTGLLWDRIQSIPLEQISDVEYLKEFHTNSMKIKVGDGSENLVFYDDKDGIDFFRYIREKLRKKA